MANSRSILNLVIRILLLLLLAPQGLLAAGKTASSKPLVPLEMQLDAIPSNDYGKAFELTRRILARSSAREFLRKELSDFLEIPEEAQTQYKFPDRVKNLSEGQLFLILRNHSEIWPALEEYLKSDGSEKSTFRKKFRQLLAQPSVMEKLKQFIDPTQAVPLLTPDGSPGYSEAQLFVNHPRFENGKTLPAQNLEKVWIDFIAGARKQIVLNVFDFDLISVADALIAAKKRGVDVRVGIDAGVIKEREKVQAIFDRLKAGRVTVRAVDSVGLNHQKIAARDWDAPTKARVLFSSGNLTRSCIGPQGDLGDDARGNPYSIPNANHTIVMKSWVLAQLINHELSKTIDMGLRGTIGENSYPLSGSYLVLGERGSYLIIAFSPGGGLGDINEHIIAKAIRSTSGPIRMAQFAFSSDKVEQALYERAEQEIQKKGRFDFRSVGDKPFTLSFWSMFLRMSGLSFPAPRIVPVERSGNDPLNELERPMELGLVDLVNLKQYTALPENKWEQLLGEGSSSFYDSIRTAPRVYGSHMVNGVEVTSKIHHKVIMTGPSFITGSFNFSQAALSNQEYIMVVVDPGLRASAEAMFEGLWRQTDASLSVRAQAFTRNEFLKRKKAYPTCDSKNKDCVAVAQ